MQGIRKHARMNNGLEKEIRNHDYRISARLRRCLVASWKHGPWHSSHHARQHREKNLPLDVRAGCKVCFELGEVYRHSENFTRTVVKGKDGGRSRRRAKNAFRADTQASLALAYKN